MAELQANVILENNPEAIIFPELDDAFVGTLRRCATTEVVAYDFTKVLQLIVAETENQKRQIFDQQYNLRDDNAPIFFMPCTLEYFETRHPKKRVWVGLDEAFIGMAHKRDMPVCAVFSYEKCVKIKVREIEESDLDEEDPRAVAVEDMEFNTLGAYIGPDTPFHLENEVEIDTVRAESH